MPQRVPIDTSLHVCMCVTNIASHLDHGGPNGTKPTYLVLVREPSLARHLALDPLGRASHFEKGMSSVHEYNWWKALGGIVTRYRDMAEEEGRADSAGNCALMICSGDAQNSALLLPSKSS
jgi:hypothetical protein